MTTQLMNPMLRRLIRVESKLHNLASFCGVPREQLPTEDFTPKHVYTEAEMTKALVRIESKLQSLMLHQGLNPHDRVSV